MAILSSGASGRELLPNSSLESSDDPLRVADIGLVKVAQLGDEIDSAMQVSRILRPAIGRPHELREVAVGDDHRLDGRAVIASGSRQHAAVRQWSDLLRAPERYGVTGAWAWVAGGLLTRSELIRVCRWQMVAGVLLLAAGGAAGSLPILTTVSAGICFGLALSIAGVAIGVHAVPARLPVRAGEALFTVLVGIAVTIPPLDRSAAVDLVLPAWLVVSGTLAVTHAMGQFGGAEAWSTALGGVLSVVCACLIAAGVPSSEASSGGVLIGILLIFRGELEVIGARSLKRQLRR